MNAKTRAIELYNEHLALASTDGRNFRKTVMDTLMAETGCTLAAAATHYNTAKKQSAPVQGLGRAPVAKGVRKPGANKGKPDAVQDDDECYTVLELLKHKDDVTVGRCRSHLMQGDASEDFDDRIKFNPPSVWIMIKGLGPIHGDTFKLGDGEVEIKRYTPAVEAVVEKEPVLEY
jgi:hypothetical protein